DGIRVFHVTGVQTCALPICRRQQGMCLSPVSKDTYLAGAGLPSVGLAQPGIDQAGILGAADWLDHGAVVAGRFVIGATGVDWTQIGRASWREGGWVWVVWGW